MKRLKSNKRGVSTVIVVMLSLVLLVIVVANVILWSYEMNEHDWQRAQEKVNIAEIQRTTSSDWFAADREFGVVAGTWISGTYFDTMSIGGDCETFIEDFPPESYTPSSYLLSGSTTYISGKLSDLAVDDDQRLTFRSYASAFAEKTIYAHTELALVSGVRYYQLKSNASDASGTSLDALCSTTGRKLLGKFVYALTGVTQIPANIWTINYRAIKGGLQLVVHGDVDIMVRKADGTIRAAISTDAAASPNFADTWDTASATYSWSDYKVVDGTDLLEIDIYAHVTNSQANRHAYVRVDDSGLAPDLQTRIEHAMLPRENTAQVELIGFGSLEELYSLTWVIDSALTIPSANVTIQMYNYDASGYQSFGDGYLTYVSSSTPNIGEKRVQEMLSNPTFFIDSTGEWKVRITVLKDSPLQFDLGLGYLCIEAHTTNTNRLAIEGIFTIDLSTYPLDCIGSIEMLIRFRANDSTENWFLKAFDWRLEEYSDLGFNSTQGSSSAMEYANYALNFQNAWRSYVSDNGTIKISFAEALPDDSSTPINVDFFGIRAIIEGAKISFQNDGPVTSHIVALWVTNSTMHRRYDADFFINSGSRGDYLKADMPLPNTVFVVKAITERGNIAILRSD